MSEPDGKIHVVIDNVHEIGTAKTEEVEPEHFSIQTFTMAAGQPSDVRQNQILSLDPLRRDAIVIPVDAAIVLCDSTAQASATQNFVATIPAPAGGYIPSGLAVTIKGTGPLWVAGPTATRITVITNRRGSS